MYKIIQKLLAAIAAIITSGAAAQCPDYSGDINSLPVCGSYGDANGNSLWNWELTDKNNPSFCNMWYARTSNSSIKTAMKSPFVDPATTAIDAISQAGDFTRAKGWELLRRDFGCAGVTAYPYFVLYNKYSGLMRIFVYQPESQPQYSGIIVQIEPTKNPWPAITSVADEAAIAPDKYFNANQAGNFGKTAVAVSEPSGGSRWSVAEFLPSFDPNIQNAVYSGTGLKFTIFGVTTFDIKSKIKGRSVGTSDPKAYNFNYVPKIPPSSSDGQNFSFTALGEKFTKFGKGLSDLRNGINAGASRIMDAFPTVSVFDRNALGRFKALAFAARESTQSDEGFGELLGKASSFATGAGKLIGFINNTIAFFTGINPGTSKPAPMPVYTSYDMELYGTITAKTVSQSFILRVPGTVQPNNDNATYYKCPMGIFNIKNTPEADTVMYDRVYDVKYAGQCCLTTHKMKYVSYRIRNSLAASFNDGAGLELVSAQAAIVGTVRPDGNGNASYNPIADHYRVNPDTWQSHNIYNLMLPDFEAGRLLISNFDLEKGLHVFQTPYVNLECINGHAFNVDERTDVTLRIKAVLRKKNDPDDSPILFMQDYKIDVFQGNTPNTVRANHLTLNSVRILPPYSNCTIPPLGVSDNVVSNRTYAGTDGTYADNVIQTQNSVIVPSGTNITFRAGNEVALAPGFEARSGSNFSATVTTSGFNLTCGTPNNEAFQFTGNCYNTSIVASRKNPGPEKFEIETDHAGELKLFPTLSSGTIRLTGEQLPHASIIIADQSGRIAYQYNHNSENKQLDLHLQHLANGVYFVKISTSEQTITRKIVISK